MKLQRISNLLQNRVVVHGGAITFLVLVAGFAFYRFWTLRSERGALEEEHRTLASLVRNERTMRLKHHSLAQQVDSMKQNRKSGAQSGPRKPNDAEFLTEVSQLAKNEQLTIKSYSPGQLTETGLQLQLTASGAYPNLARFLDGIVKISFLCELTQCAINAPQQPTDPCEMELTIQILNPVKVWPRLASTGSER